MKKLGFGLMRLPQKDDKLDIEQIKDMVDRFLANGFTYFDTAWMYCGGESENAVREALVSRHPRDSFLLADKLHCGYFNTKEEREEYFETQLKKTGAGYFDYYLIHCINRDMYKKHTELDSFSWLIEKKKQGLVKKIGFSFHDSAEFLEGVIAAHPEFEFVQLQINYLDWESQRVQSRLCYETARRHGLPIIIMEPVKGGTLAKLPQAAEALFKAHLPDMSVPSWAIRFCAGLPGVMLVLSGMSDLCQLEDNMSYMSDFSPLDDTEQDIIKKATAHIIDGRMIQCTGCEYCVGGCPSGIAIPSLFKLYNEDSRVDKTDKAAYGDIGTPASSCIECGACVGACPQKLDIPELLKKLTKKYE